MAGPPYPSPPPFKQDASAIGMFVIGQSPIGSISPFYVWNTIISQYSDSPIIDGLITAFAAAMDMTYNYDQFYDNMLNVITANGYGLDVWGRIVGVTRTVQLLTPSSATYLGYYEAHTADGADFTGTFGATKHLTATAVTGTITIGATLYGPGVPAGTTIQSQSSGPAGGTGVYVTNNQTSSVAANLIANPGTFSWVGFGQAPFYTGAGAGNITTAYQLDDKQFLQLILAKAAANITDGSIPSVNQILLGLFPNRGVCYVQDNLNMTLTYVFNFSLSAIDLAIVTQSGVLPTAAGVGVTIQHL